MGADPGRYPEPARAPMTLDSATPPPRRPRAPLALLAAALAGAALGGGALLLSERLHAPAPRPTKATVPPAPASPSTAAPRAATPGWRCPMHPDIARDGPGRCPLCGMALVKDDGEAGAAPDPR